MSTLLDIIRDEKERLEELLTFYEEEISRYPKGYLSKRTRNGHVYCYRAFREGNTVKTIYIGLESSDEVKVLTKEMKRKKDLEEKYRQAKVNLKEAKGLLRGKE
jgi:hypothetical protein